MFHTLAWTGSVNPGAGVLVELTPVADGIMPIASGANEFIPEEDMYILWGLAMGATLTSARFNSAKIRQTNPKYIRPIEGNAAPGSRAGCEDYSQAPFRISGQENFITELRHSAAIAEQDTIIAGIMPVRFGLGMAVPSGDQYKVRWTSTTAATANAWTLLTITFETALPAGQYSVVNHQHFSANGQAARLILDNQFYRPGAPSLATAVSIPPWNFIDPMYGEWGRFYAYSPPRVEVLCNGADAVHEGYFTVIKLS